MNIILNYLGFLFTVLIWYLIIYEILFQKSLYNLSRILKYKYPNITPPDFFNLVSFSQFLFAIKMLSTFISKPTLFLHFNNYKDIVYKSYGLEEIMKNNDEEIQTLLHKIGKQIKNIFYSEMLILLFLVIFIPLELIVIANFILN